MTKPRTAAIVLAAGKGTRMRSDLAKVLHPLAGRPMIGHVLASLEALAPDLAVVVVGPDMADVAAAVAPLPTVVQDRPRGSADAVLAARAAVEGKADDVLVVLGDAPLVRPETLERLVSARRARPAPALVVLGMRPDDPGHYGRLVTGPDGALEAVVEFADAGPGERAISLCNAGLLAADGAVLFELLEDVGNDNAKGEYYLPDVVGLARARGLACAVVEGDAAELMGVNSRADLAAAEAALQARLRAAAMENGATLVDPGSVYLSADTRLGRDVVVGPGVVFGPGVTVGDKAQIRAFCHIEGARLAAGAVVGPFARLRPGAEVGAQARVGNFVEVKNASIEAGAKVNHLSYVGDARVGAGANIGAGTITCNYDGFAKARTEIGAGAFIGSNTALVAPVTVGEGAVVGAGSVITADVEDDALAVARAEQTNRPGWAARFRASRQAQGERQGERQGEGRGQGRGRGKRRSPSGKKA